MKAQATLTHLEEVNLAVPRPHKGCIDVVRYPGKALGDQLGVATVWGHIIEAPVAVTLEREK